MPIGTSRAIAVHQNLFHERRRAFLTNGQAIIGLMKRGRAGIYDLAFPGSTAENPTPPVELPLYS